MKRLALLSVLVLAGCRSAPTPAAAGAGALANVALATAVGGARVATGECFTICAPGTTCNLKTKLCDTLPCRDACGPNETCQVTATSEKCVPAPGLAVTQKHDANADEKLPIGTTPPLSSAPPSSPQHPDVPGASP
ncbi:MAG: hypothetical protein JST54_05360 [Deltaproteobacteria bacterium]|nr:hypothetical protein [Deltaproteobacteria bacterium]